jgi:hypothetical protein
MYYLCRENEQGLPLDEELGRARIELEKVRSKGEGASLMALHYSLRPLEKALSVNVQPSTEASSRVQSLMDDIRNYLEKYDTARGSQLQRTISRIKEMLRRDHESPARPNASPAPPSPL